MKRCSSCRNCVTDARALMMGIFVQKCRLGGHVILHPFFSGFRCGRYRKIGKIKEKAPARHLWN